jgi:ABC-type branched-subunit amino acid transport system substrate-binding protein
MLTSSLRRSGLALSGAALLTVIAGCSTRAEDTPSAAAEGEVQTGRGVSGDTIKLGVITDFTGVFAASGKEVTQAMELYWEQRNADGGICDAYQVELVVQDSEYNVQRAVSVYSSMHNDVLALQQTLGSAITLGLLPSLEEDDMLAVAHTNGPELLGLDNVIMTGATFDVEAINGLSALLERGLIKEGDKIGHIYFTGGYGEGALAGAKAFAEEHGLTIIEHETNPTVNDLTAPVTRMRSEGVAAVVLSAAPPQLASLMGATEASGLEVPVLGSSPAYTAGLLTSPAAAALRERFYTVYPVASFDNEAANDFRDAYVAQFPGENPTLQILNAYVEAEAMAQILETACAEGDLTPEGVLAAKNGLKSVSTDGIAPELDFSDNATGATLEDYLLRVGDQPGGLTQVEGPFVSDEAKGYVEGR